VRRWERFSPQDSSTLERALRDESIAEVEVYLGRYTAHIQNRWIQAYYWKENKWPIVRGTWFWKDPANADVCPFGEADSSTLEEAYMDLLTGREEGPIDCELVDTDIVLGTVQFVRDIFKNAASSTTTSTPISAPSTAPPPPTTITYALYRPLDRAKPDDYTRSERLEVYRGFPSQWIPRSEEQLGSKISHLFLAVHGIGEALYNRQNDPYMGSMRFRGNCDLIRENMNNKLLETVSSKNREIEDGRIEVLPIEWSESIHCNFLDRRLESVTLPTLAGVRDFANLALTDVFLYTQSDIQEKILQHVADRIGVVMDKFQQRHQTTTQRVSFIGHSLGGVVIYDLFVKNFVENFSFQPSSVFFLGSPLSMFLTIRDPFREVESQGDSLMKLPLHPNCRMFNIFHPYDAIAYRLEPLIDMRLKHSEAALVPYKGGHRVHVAIRKSVATVISSIGEWLTSNNPPPVITIGNENSHHHEMEPAEDVRRSRYFYPQKNHHKVGGLKTSTGPPLSSSSSTSSSATISSLTVSSSSGTMCESEEIRRVRNLNFNERIDWMLQESAVESVSEWVSAVGSHFTYWRHDDVYNFIISQLLNIDRVRGNCKFI